MSEDRLVEAQAVLAFNLNPKDGIAYVKRKLKKTTEDEIGEWLGQVCTEKGGLDPTMLGDYFSRRDTLQIFWNFVRRIDFSQMDIVAALRQLFDTFKPGGEGQVITRILEYFAESYYQQWAKDPAAMQPVCAYANSDTVFQVAVSLIMLNTGLHVAAKKLGKKAASASMSLEEYIANTRRLVSAEEVPDEALRAWFEDIRSCTEISVEPMPRTPFSKLPVQPNIEGWLVAVLNGTILRFWAVLVLQRIYLFSDSVGDVDPADVIDLKDIAVVALQDEEAARKRYLDHLAGSRRFCCRRRAKPAPWLLAAAERSLEISQRNSGPPAILQKSCKSPPRRLVLVAESADLAEKWAYDLLWTVTPHELVKKVLWLMWWSIHDAGLNPILEILERHHLLAFLDWTEWLFIPLNLMGAVSIFLSTFECSTNNNSVMSLLHSITSTRFLCVLQTLALLSFVVQLCASQYLLAWTGAAYLLNHMCIYHQDMIVLVQKMTTSLAMEHSDGPPTSSLLDVLSPL
ncbi:unnamed protein product, partial [Effrenium voratum]